MIPARIGFLALCAVASLQLALGAGPATVDGPRSAWSAGATPAVDITGTSSTLLMREFALMPGQVKTVRALLGSEMLKSAIWGQAAAPQPGCTFILDGERQRLIVYGRPLHMERMEMFLNALAAGDGAAEGTAPRTTVRDAAPKAGGSAPTGPARSIENIQIPPAGGGEASPVQTREYNRHVVEVVKTFLYGRDGERAAAAEGRRVWFDEASGQVSIVDSPENLARASAYLHSLDEVKSGVLKLDETFEQRQPTPSSASGNGGGGFTQRAAPTRVYSGSNPRQTVLYPQYITAETMAQALSQTLNLPGAGAAGGGGVLGGAFNADERTIRLNRGGEVQYHGWRIRLIRVQQNNTQDIYDDAAEFAIIGPANVSNLTIRQYETQFFQNLEITGVMIRAVISNTTQTSSGLGTASIKVRLRPVAN